MKRPQPTGDRAIDLIEEAFHLVRLAPGSALAAYAAGTIPFLLGLLYFWADMSRSAFAEERLVPGVFVLTGLFVWMKTWQSIYCRHLLAELQGESAPAWTWRRFISIALREASVQPFGLFLLPLSLTVMVPFGWVYAYFTSATVIHGTDNPNLRTAIGRSWRQMLIWSGQSHAAIALLGFLALFVFINLFSLVNELPSLLKSLLGIESVFSRNPMAAVNSTMLSALVALTYLCLDPVAKAAFVLRCFHGEAIATGHDLRADLRMLARNAAASLKALWLPLTLVASMTFMPPALAASATATDNIASKEEQSAPTSAPARSVLAADRLDRSIDRTIQKREYSWRLPREGKEKKADTTDDSFLARTFKSIESTIEKIGQSIDDIIDWIRNGFSNKGKSSGSGLNLHGLSEVAMIFLIALFLGLVGWVLYRIWRNRPQEDVVTAEPIGAAPDLSAENVTAADLPEDGWLRLARELLERGDTRLALRALYLASLAHLESRRLITLARSKSNHEYARELQRRAHAIGQVPQIFTENLHVFERAWYGRHEVTMPMIDSFSLNLDRIKQAT